MVSITIYLGANLYYKLMRENDKLMKKLDTDKQQVSKIIQRALENHFKIDDT